MSVSGERKIIFILDTLGQNTQNGESEKRKNRKTQNVRESSRQLQVRGQRRQGCPAQGATRQLDSIAQECPGGANVEAAKCLHG